MSHFFWGFNQVSYQSFTFLWGANGSRPTIENQRGVVLLLPFFACQFHGGPANAKWMLVGYPWIEWLLNYECFDYKREKILRSGAKRAIRFIGQSVWKLGNNVPWKWVLLNSYHIIVEIAEIMDHQVDFVYTDYDKYDYYYLNLLDIVFLHVYQHTFIFIICIYIYIHRCVCVCARCYCHIRYMFINHTLHVDRYCNIYCTIPILHICWVFALLAPDPGSVSPVEMAMEKEKSISLLHLSHLKWKVLVKY